MDTLFCNCCKNIIGYQTQSDRVDLNLYCVKCYKIIAEQSEKTWESFSDSNPTNVWNPRWGQRKDVIKYIREVGNIEVFGNALPAPYCHFHSESVLESLEKYDIDILEIYMLRALKKGGYTKAFNYVLTCSTDYYKHLEKNR